MPQWKTGKDVFTEGLDRMLALYEAGHRVVVSFSAGKDSGICLELCVLAAQMTGRLPVDVCMRDEEIMFPGTFEYAERVAARPDVRFHWLIANQPIVNVFNRRQPYFWVFDPALPPEQWVRQPPKIARVIPEKNIQGLITLERFPPAEGKQLFAVPGLRTQESPNRKLGLYSSGSYLTKANAWGVRNARPIYDWQDGDVWKAHKDNGWDYNCNPYEAPIWMGDLTFKPIGEVVQGDSVTGWRKGRGDGSRSTLCASTVLQTHKYTAQVFKVTLASGKVIRCTRDHQWLTSDRGKGANWRLAIPQEGRCLAHIVDKPADLPEGKAWEAAWLAGIYDGEGSYQRIYQHEQANGIYLAIRKALDSLALPYTVMNKHSPAQHGFSLTGGRQTLVDFVNWCKPVKRDQIISMVLNHRFRDKDEIVSIEPELVRDVYALTTTTGNYVCWGYASSNSAYDVMHRMGVSRNKLRIAPPTLTASGVDSLQHGSKAWPRWFDRVADRLEGVRTAAMFGKGALVPVRRLGETWEECFQRTCIDEAPEWIAQRSAQIKERMLREHAYHSTAPFPQMQPCPKCRLLPSWKILTEVFYMGDPFSLKQDRLPYIEPEFFRAGAGTWGKGKPSF